MPQSYTCLHYHLVFSTKDRRPLIHTAWGDRLYAYIGGTVRAMDGILLRAGGTPDHVHLLCSLSKQTAVADALRSIKANASRWVHETIAEAKGFGWQKGYGAFTVSHSGLDAVRDYIDRQDEHHRRMTFQEEFLALLARHDVTYDEQYIWA